MLYQFLICLHYDMVYVSSLYIDTSAGNFLGFFFGTTRPISTKLYLAHTVLECNNFTRTNSALRRETTKLLEFGLSPCMFPLRVNIV